MFHELENACVTPLMSQGWLICEFAESDHPPFFHPWYRHAIRGKQNSANSPHGWHGDTTDEKDSVEPQILPNPIN